MKPKTQLALIEIAKFVFDAFDTVLRVLGFLMLYIIIRAW